MSLGNIFVIIFLSYYTIYFATFFSKNRRKIITKKNIELNQLRTKAYKTVKQQKEFINLKYPKKGKIIFTPQVISKIIVQLGIFGALFFIFNQIFKYFKIELAIWQGLLMVTILPIFINFILSRFNLQKEDISIYFK